MGRVWLPRYFSLRVINKSCVDGGCGPMSSSCLTQTSSNVIPFCVQVAGLGEGRPIQPECVEGQKMTLGSQCSPSTRWVLGLNLGKCPCLLNHLADLYFGI